MSKDSKTSEAILLLVDELRGMRGAIVQIQASMGILSDNTRDLRDQVEQRNASHDKTTRQVTELDARVTLLERAGPSAAE